LLQQVSVTEKQKLVAVQAKLEVAVIQDKASEGNYGHSLDR
jgi:hypothetical protein